MTDDKRKILEDFFKKLLKEQLFINMLVIDEVLYISKKYGIHYDTTLDFLRNILSPYIEIISIEEEDLKFIEKFLLNYNLRPSDAIHLATMEKAGIKNIVTEDEDFDKVKEVKRIWLNAHVTL